MMARVRLGIGFLAALLLGAPVAVCAPSTSQQESDAITWKVMEAQAAFAPEKFSTLGVSEFDDDVLDLNPQLFARSLACNRSLVLLVDARRSTADDPALLADLDILKRSLLQTIRTASLDREHLLPYFKVPEVVFLSFRALLDPRIERARRAAALVRLRRYAGLEPGYAPLTERAIERTEERLVETGLTGPHRTEVERDLANAPYFNSALTQLFEQSHLDGWSADLALLQRQLQAYADWTRRVVLPRARDKTLLPRPVYEDRLRQAGVDVDPVQLLEEAQAAWVQQRFEMQSLAHRIAQQRKLPSGDYREVMKELKREQLARQDLVPLYQKRLQALEDIVRRENIVTLPARSVVIRLATDAEAAANPSSFMNPPPLVRNSGERGEFVVVTSNPAASGEQAMDDWSHDSVTWTLAAHEARPGHELQFATMLEAGVSLARRVYAFNSANVEGWGLYSEMLVKEFLPLEGQLFALQGLTARTARAFLDPMVNLGLIEPQQALQFLMREVGLSRAMAQSEVDRYVFRAPGQATAYLYGYRKLIGLRGEVEFRLGSRFDQRAFHDFILAQGLAPPDMLRDAVMRDFVAPRSAVR